jgi:hypothetical protein
MQLEESFVQRPFSDEVMIVEFQKCSSRQSPELCRKLDGSVSFRDL